MAYKNGTYVAFHAQGTNIPIDSDIKYYNLLKAWTAKKDDDFSFTNSHEKTYAVRDTSNKTTLQNRLKERLNASKNMLLIIGDTTRYDTDWVPFEITYAVDICGLPLLVVYPDTNYVINPSTLSYLWPKALSERISSGKVKAIHLPFNKSLLADAIDRFTLSNMPPNGLWYYSREAYQSIGIQVPFI